MEPCFAFRTFCCPTNTSSPTLMTCTSCACQVSRVTCKRHWISKPAPKYTWGKLRCGVAPLYFAPGCPEMQGAAARVDPGQRLARRGTTDFVQAELRATTEKHRSLVERIPLVRGLQSAWLLVLFCANEYATYSAETEQFAAAHDVATWQCFTQLLGISGEAHDWVRVCHSRWVGAVCGGPPERGSQPTGPTVSG